MSNLNQRTRRFLTDSESALKDSESARTFLKITLNRIKAILVSEVCCPYVSRFPPSQTAAPSFDSCTSQTPMFDENREVYRDYEYKRPGTVSLLAAIGLLTVEAIPLVSQTHKSSDFVRFLKILDLKYPAQDPIRIILDNHSAHKSKETRAFLGTKPEWRFEFVFTPKHGS